MKKITAIILIFVFLFSMTAHAAVKNLNIAVLCYHSVSDNPLNLSTYRISQAELEEDIKYFQERGYQFMLPREMWLANPSDKNLVLTFDDGYEDFYDVVFPLLKKYNVKAAVYIIASRIDKAGYLNSEQIKELDSSGLVEIGNHATAIHFCGYTREVLLSDRRILNEYVEDVKECSRRIYTILGHGTESIAYPGGVYTPQLDQIIRVNLGYTTTFTTDHGLVKTNYDVVGPMKRIYRVHGDTPEKIEKMIQELKQC